MERTQCCAKSIQIGTVGRQDERLNTGGMKRISERSAELAVAVMQNKPDREQGTVDRAGPREAEK
jgi:hypothetical protein